MGSDEGGQAGRTDASAGASPRLFELDGQGKNILEKKVTDVIVVNKSLW